MIGTTIKMEDASASLSTTKNHYDVVPYRNRMVCLFDPLRWNIVMPSLCRLDAITVAVRTLKGTKTRIDAWRRIHSKAFHDIQTGSVGPPPVRLRLPSLTSNHLLFPSQPIETRKRGSRIRHLMATSASSQSSLCRLVL
jgi:hypothetical protein